MPKVLKRNRQANKAQSIKVARVDFKAAIHSFKATKPSAVKGCPLKPAYGSGPEAQFHKDLAKKLKIKPSARSRQDKKEIKNNSEGIGEAATIDLLRTQLEKRGIPYDPKGLQTFSASGVFNVVYLSPAPTKIPDPAYKPAFVFVMEAKGGESECKDRDDGTGKRVQQGTLPYCSTVANLMAKSNYKRKSKKPADVAERDRRRLTGKAVLEAMKNNTGVYAGVRGGYTEDNLYKPEMIFSQQF